MKKLMTMIGAVAGAISAFAHTVTVSAGSAGTVSVNGGTAAATATAEVEDKASVTLAATPNDDKAFSHWTGDVYAITGEGGIYSAEITVTATNDLTLTATFGLRNKNDSSDTRPHGYLNRFTQNADGTWKNTWTDGTWTDAKNASWWLDNYVPTNKNDVMHFANWQQPDGLFHSWIDWPARQEVFGTIADSSPQSKFNLTSGWTRYYYIQNQENSHARWQNELDAMGGFGTTDENSPHRINRVWVGTALGINTPKAEHELTIHELSGGGFVRKVGPGKLTLEQPSGGGLRLEAGTVVMGLADLEDGYVPGALAQFDASATNTMTWAAAPDGKPRLTKWEDVNGTKNAKGSVVNVNAPYTNSGCTWYGPTLGSKKVRGVSLLDFGAYTKGASSAGSMLGVNSVYPGEKEELGASAGLNCNTYLYNSVRAAFMAFEFPSQGGTISPVSYWSEGTGDGSRQLHVKASGDGLVSSKNDDLQFRGAFYENGAPFKSEVNENHGFRDGHSFAVIAGCVTNNGTGAPFWHMGLKPGEYTSGGIRVAETLVYTNSLTEAEIARNNRWMQLKWHDRAVNDVYPWTLDYLMLCNSTGDSELRVEANHTAAIRTVHRPIWKELAGRPLVKTGEGTLELDRCSTNLDVEVKGGHVRFIRETAQIADDPQAPAGHPYVWLDATQADRFVFQEGSTTNIVAWLDRRPTAPHSFTNWVTTARAPTFNANGLHGKPCVDFGTEFDANGPRLAVSSATNSNTKGVVTAGAWAGRIADVFIVWRNIAKADVNPYIVADNNGSTTTTWMRNSKNGLCSGPDTSYWSYSTGAMTSTWRVDGRFMMADGEFSDAGRDDYIVVRCRSHQFSYKNQIGGAGKSGNGGGCQIAEYIAYDYMLSDFAARQTEAYLLKKWKGAKHPDACPELDRIDSLTFDAGVEPVLETASDRAFGRVAGTGTLVKNGAGCATVGTLSGFTGLSFALPATGTTAPQLAVSGAFDLATFKTIRVDVEGGAKPAYGDFPLVSADSFTGSLSEVTLETGVSRAVVSLVITDGRLCARIAPKGLCIIIR